jgi:hypothetical protein
MAHRRPMLRLWVGEKLAQKWECDPVHGLI